MKRFMSFLCAVVMICVFACPIAQASGDGQITPRIASCGNCGGSCSRVYVTRNTRGAVIGYCKHGTHRYAEEGVKWVCDNCGNVEYKDIEVGHYCTGDNGHYCFGSCDCEK